LTDAPINRSIEHGLHGARSRAYFHRASSCGVGDPRGPWQFALLGPGRWGAAIRLRPLRPIRSRCTLSPAGCYPIRNRVRACDAATPCGALSADPPRFVVVLRRLEEPSPKSSRPLTSIVARRHHRVGSKPTGSYRPTRLSWCVEYRIHPQGQDRPTVPPRREVRRYPSSRERMEERPKTPSVVSSPLRACA